MKVLTKVPHKDRHNTLTELMNDIYSNPLAAEVLKGWGIEFSRTLLDMDARIMHVEKISHGSNTYIYIEDQSDIGLL